MKFEKEKMKSRYWSYNNYLKARCEALPNQIERRFKNSVVYHTSSTCSGMSNYVNIEKQDENGEYIDSITIRISDHKPTGSGEQCDHYVYIEGYLWTEIKSNIMEIISDFMEK